MNQLILRTPEGEVEIGVGKMVRAFGEETPWKITQIFTSVRGVLFALLSNNGRLAESPISDLRPVPQPKTVPLTDADVLAMCRNGGVEFKTVRDNWVGCGDYFVQKDGSILLRSTELVELTHYRLADENWEIEHEMTKTV